MRKPSEFSGDEYVAELSNDVEKICNALDALDSVTAEPRQYDTQPARFALSRLISSTTDASGVLQEEPTGPSVEARTEQDLGDGQSPSSGGAS